MSPREQQFTGPGPQDHPTPIHSIDTFIQSVLYGDAAHDHWQVVLHDCSSGEDHLCRYTAASADDAESMAHCDAIESDPLGSYAVRALHAVPRRSQWDVRLHERAQLHDPVPAGVPRLVGRVIAVHEKEARALALTTFGLGQRVAGADDGWRHIGRGDVFTVVRC